MAKYIRATQKQFIKRGAWRQNYPQHGQGVIQLYEKTHEGEEI